MPKKKDFTAIFQQERLHSAAQAGDLPAVDRWLTAKYPVNRFDEFGKTPLHYAVEEGHLEVVDRLLRAKANVNAHDERCVGNTPLSDNIQSMSVQVVQKLLGAGADPTIRGWMNLSAIDRAAQRKDADAQKILHLLQDAAKR